LAPVLATCGENGLRVVEDFEDGEDIPPFARIFAELVAFDLAGASHKRNHGLGRVPDQAASGPHRVRESLHFVRLDLADVPLAEFDVDWEEVDFRISEERALDQGGLFRNGRSDGVVFDDDVSQIDLDDVSSYFIWQIESNIPQRS
jgi:hypothetical protein